MDECIVHLIRNKLKYVSYKDGKELAQDLKLIYTASSEDEAYKNLQELKEKWSKRKVSLENWKNNGLADMKLGRNIGRTEYLFSRQGYY